MKKIEDNFVPYNEASRLKELGFDEECIGYFENQDKKFVGCYNTNPILTKKQEENKKLRPKIFDTNISNSKLPQWATARPLYQQAFDWFKKEYNIVFSPMLMGMSSYCVTFHLDTEKYRNLSITGACFCEIVDIYDYDEINLEVVRELIRIVKEETKRLKNFK